MSRRRRADNIWLPAADELREGPVEWTDPENVVFPVATRKHEITEHFFRGKNRGAEYLAVPQGKAKYGETQYYDEFYIFGREIPERTTIRELLKKTTLETRLVKLTFNGTLHRADLAIRYADEMIRSYAFHQKGFHFARGRTLDPALIKPYLAEQGVIPVEIQNKDMYTAIQAKRIHEILARMAQASGFELKSNSNGPGSANDPERVYNMIGY